jgi:transcription-repair coupling factor (superfamily II helicase)
LSRAGYNLVGQVESPADCAVRGGLVDVFPAGLDRPARIEFFGDYVESIRSFRIDDQKSVAQLDSLLAPPVSEVEISQEAGAAAAAALERLALERGWLGLLWEPVAERFRAGAVFGDSESWAPLFAPPRVGLHGYLADPDVRLLLWAPERLEEAGLEAWRKLERHFDRLAAEERPHMPLDSLFLHPAQLLGRLREVKQGLCAAKELADDDRRPEAGYDVRLEVPCESNGDLKALMSVPRRATGLLGPVAARIRALLGRGLTVRLVLRSKEQSKRLAEMLAEYDLSPGSSLGGRKGAGALMFAVGQLSAGFAAPFDLEAFISEDEIFGSRQRRRRRASEEFRGLKGFAGLKDLSPGDFVVHADHGIGQYLGLETLTTTSGHQGDFIHLTYRGGDVLYVPVERFSSVAKYVGSSARPPHLDRLGSGSWEKLKSKVKDGIRQMAEELINLYAARQTVDGHAFTGRDHMLAEFESSFQYDATPDQERAIDEVLADLAAPRPMDRLVCGDVGFGKTEVAMRAAFKVVCDGKQVAVLVPTTILADQHDRSFAERMSAWPIRVASLSRFKKPAEQREILQELAEGRIDVLVGTHRLLQKDVRFKDLGLLVIDEEHRFGVSDKERLKKLRTSVDVLSMSATPIPRSLSMSMNGIRDMSVIETSPQDRLAVKTKLMRCDDEAIAEAIDSELERGGQVFFIHNWVRDIEGWIRRLQSLRPLVRFGVGHGQMSPAELENVMSRFLKHEIDVWVSTSIVESGLDFPAANTIIIDRADRFGLAQLYQLRGRVGRGHVQAYAYLMVDDPDTLTSDARKRIKALLDHTDLGSGYQIALHDLQIRGSGNILGAAQSGQAALVGFEMYSQLMEQAVRELRHEPQVEEHDPEVVAGLPAYLPESYAPDTEVRLILYRRLSSAKNEAEVAEIAAEMEDRLGRPPDEARNLLDLMEVKILLKRTRARRLESGEEGLTLTFGPEGPANHDKVLSLIGGARRNRLTPSGRLFVVKGEYQRPGRPLEGVKEFLARLN